MSFSELSLCILRILAVANSNSLGWVFVVSLFSKCINMLISKNNPSPNLDLFH